MIVHWSQKACHCHSEIKLVAIRTTRRVRHRYIIIALIGSYHRIAGRSESDRYRVSFPKPKLSDKLSKSPSIFVIDIFRNHDSDPFLFKYFDTFMALGLERGLNRAFSRLKENNSGNACVGPSPVQITGEGASSPIAKRPAKTLLYTQPPRKIAYLSPAPAASPLSLSGTRRSAKPAMKHQTSVRA